VGLLLALGDEHGLSVFEIELPRKIFDFNKEEITGDWNKNCMNRDCIIVPISTNIIPVIRYI